MVMGNFHGFNAYDIESAKSPRLLASIVCPGGQGDVSIYGNLLFMSVEQTRGRIDCGTQGVVEPVSKERFRGVRIFDITDITQSRSRSRRCRPAAARTRIRWCHEGQADALRLRLRHRRRALGRGGGRLLRRRPEGKPEHRAVQHRRDRSAARRAREGARRQSPAHFLGREDRRASPACSRAAITVPARSAPAPPTSATTSRCIRKSASRPAPARATAS